METTIIVALVLTLLFAVMLLLSSRDAVAELAGVLLLSSRDAVAKFAGVTLAAMLPSREPGSVPIDFSMVIGKDGTSEIKDIDRSHIKKVISVRSWGCNYEYQSHLRRKYGDNCILIVHNSHVFNDTPVITNEGEILTKEDLFRIYSREISYNFSEFYFFRGDNLFTVGTGLTAAYMLNPELEDFVSKLGHIHSADLDTSEEGRIEVVFCLEDDGNGLKEEHAKKAMKHKCSVP